MNEQKNFFLSEVVKREKECSLEIFRWFSIGMPGQGRRPQRPDEKPEVKDEYYTALGVKRSRRTRVGQRTENGKKASSDRPKEMRSCSRKSVKRMKRSQIRRKESCMMIMERKVEQGGIRIPPIFSRHVGRKKRSSRGPSGPKKVNRWYIL